MRDRIQCKARDQRNDRRQEMEMCLRRQIRQQMEVRQESIHTEIYLHMWLVTMCRENLESNRWEIMIF